MDINKIKNYINNFYEGFKNDEQKRNRVLILFLVFIGFCSVIVGFSNTKNIIKKPFEDKEKEAIASIYETYDQLKAQGKIKEEDSSQNIDTTKTTYSDDNAKNTDTDSDGISDYDEANIFKTSAFLADSDGDGISDYDEVKNGNDPNCPVGKVCSMDSNTNSAKDSNSDTNYNSIDPNNIDIKQARKELEKIIPDSLKPMLANMSDDQIKSLVTQLYSGANTEGTANTTTTTNSNIPSTNNTNKVVSDYKSVLKSKLPQFSPAQIAIIKEMPEVEVKKLLLDSNIADESLLSSFKTGELKSTVLGE